MSLSVRATVKSMTFGRLASSMGTAELLPLPFIKDGVKKIENITTKPIPTARPDITAPVSVASLVILYTSALEVRPLLEHYATHDLVLPHCEM